jgi:hypothetical protein
MCCRTLPGCIEALPVECLDTRRHRLALSVVSESERHPHSIGNGKFKLGQYPVGELAGLRLFLRRRTSSLDVQGLQFQDKEPGVAADSGSGHTPTMTLKNCGSRACDLRTVCTRRWRGASAAHRALRLASVPAGIDNATTWLGQRLRASGDVLLVGLDGLTS